MACGPALQKEIERYLCIKEARKGVVRSGSNSFCCWSGEWLWIGELVAVATSGPPDGAVEGCLPRLSVLAPHFAKHSHSAVTQHLPNAFHGGEISIQLAAESGVAPSYRLPPFSTPLSGSAFRAIALTDELPSGPSPLKSAFGIRTSGHDNETHDNTLMTTVGSAIEPWPLLRNRILHHQRAIRLVVHGRTGGVVPDSLLELIEAVRRQRVAPVQLEVLTADKPPACPKQQCWLIPLLLWPGEHVRTDVPAIRSRLKRNGATVTMLPFLGAWPSWWTLVGEALRPLALPDSVLVHHPLRPGVADRFLQDLSDRLALPLLPFDQWPDHLQQHPAAHPLPLALAPNRMTEALSEAGHLPPLLDHPLIRQGLIDLLAALP